MKALRVLFLLCIFAPAFSCRTPSAGTELKAADANGDPADDFDKICKQKQQLTFNDLDLVNAVLKGVGAANCTTARPLLSKLTTMIFQCESKLADRVFYAAFTGMLDVEIQGAEHCRGLPWLPRLTRIRSLKLICTFGNHSGHLDNELIAEVAQLNNLEDLEIQSCYGDYSVKPLGNLAYMRRLKFDTLGQKNLADLEGLTALEELDLTATAVTDLSAILRFTNLRKITVEKSPQALASLDFFAEMANLEEVNLNDDKIDKIDGLGKIPGLQKLALNHNSISDLSPLAKLPDLTELDVAENEITDLVPLEKLPLQSLSAASNRIIDLAPIAGLSALRFLAVSSNEIADLSPVAHLTNLDQLWVSRNKIRDLSPVAALVKLTILAANDNAIEDLGPLNGLTQLNELYVSGNDALLQNIGANRSVLAALPALKYIAVDYLLVPLCPPQLPTCGH